MTTEISYLLPGTRIERITGEKHWAVGVATIAPVSDEETIVHQYTYWSLPWVGPARHVLRYLIKHFLTEDRKYALLQREGLKQQQPFMHIGDSDAQIQWFQKLRHAWLQSGSGHMPFVNPLREETLRFNS